MPNDFEQRIPHYTRRVEAKLDSVLPGSEVEPGRLHDAMRYVLTLPVSTVIVGCDSIAQLEENVNIARAFTPMSDSQLAELEARES